METGLEKLKLRFAVPIAHEGVLPAWRAGGEEESKARRRL